MKWKRIALVMLSSLMFCNSAMATSMIGIRSINNQERKIDYKVDNDAFSEMATKLFVDASRKEIFIDIPERETAQTPAIEDDSGTETRPATNITTPVNGDSSELLFDGESYSELTTSLSDKELTWLIENNIVSRDPVVTVDDTGVTVGTPPVLYDRNEPNTTIRKSDFLMGAYKAIYGVIESRTLLFQSAAWREAQKAVWRTYYDAEGTAYTNKDWADLKKQEMLESEEYLYKPLGESEEVSSTFPSGDYFTYVSPNVYELYLKELIDKNIVEFDSVSDVEFRQAYLQLGESTGSGSKAYPSWYGSLTPYSVNGAKDQTEGLVDIISTSKVLGNSYDITVNGSSVVIEKNEPSYFMREALDTMSALRYVEAMLRLTEKDMTDTEAKIVTYKYGASYLDNLEEDDRKTVMFLTAKGILNFEDQTEYRNLYGNLTKEFAYKLFYRMANENARTNFSEIQLTDSDNFWLEKGFTELKLKFHIEDPTKTDTLGDDIVLIPDVVTESVEPVAQSEEAETSSIFGIKVTKSVSRFGAPTETTGTEYYVTKIFDDPKKYRYKGTTLTDGNLKGKFSEVVSVIDSGKTRQIKFRVTAVNSTIALATVDSNIQIGTDSLFNTKGINAVTKYDEDGNSIVLVPAASFKDIASEIVILEDKVLKNKNTGATAVLLSDADIALVGTHVVHSEDLMVVSLNDEVYYNMDIITQLMSNAYISKLDPNSVYKSSSIIKETLVEVLGSTGNRIAGTYVSAFQGPFAEVESDTGSYQDVIKNFVNISQLNSASNFLIRDFEVSTSDSATTNFKVLLHFVYMLPDKDAEFTNPIYDTDSPTIMQVNKFLYNRPDDNELADWWDNNIELSNAWTNALYETTGVEYVRSGYLVPNVIILYDKEDSEPKKYVAQMLERVGTELSSEWVERFIGDSEGYNDIVTSDGATDTNNGDGIYYPATTLTADRFPKWVEAMYNNTGGTGGTEEKKNGILWRSLISSRNLTFAPSIETSGTFRKYVTEQGNYVVTEAGSVYRQITGQKDSKFPVEYDSEAKTLEIQTRTEAENNSQWAQRYVEYNGVRFYVDSIIDNKATLVDTNRVVGTVREVSKGNITTYEIDGVVKYTTGTTGTSTDGAIKARYEVLRNMFSPATAQGYESATPTYSAVDKLTGLLPRSALSSSVYFVDINGKMGYTSSAKPFKDYTGLFNNTGVLSYNASSLPLSQASAHVQIVIDLNYWSISSDGQLVMQRTSPYLQVGNVFYSGINKGIMDSIMAKHIDSKSPSELEHGSTVLIGDMVFIKMGDVFVSKPQTKLDSWSAVINDATNLSVVKKAVFSQFTGMIVKVGDQAAPLAAFVSNPSLGVPSTAIALNSALIGDSSTTSRAYVATDTDGERVVKAYSNTNIPVINSIVFKVELDDNLRFRQLDTDTKLYELLLSTPSLSEGFLEDISFFDESLGLTSKDDLYLMLTKSNFEPVTTAEDIKKEFSDSFDESFRVGVFEWTKITLQTVLSYLILMSWIACAIVNGGLGAGLLHAIKNPIRGSKSNGIDLLSLLSFGLYDIDTPVPIGRMILTNLFMFMLIYAIGYYF